MEDRSSRRLRTLVTHWPVRGLSANENAGALISMMARSTNRSNQRPDTLMQDRRADRSMKTSCDARPDHTNGSSLSVSRHGGRRPVCLQQRKDLLSLSTSTAYQLLCREDAGHGRSGPRLCESAPLRNPSRIAFSVFDLMTDAVSAGDFCGSKFRRKFYLPEEAGSFRTAWAASQHFTRR